MAMHQLLVRYTAAGMKAALGDGFVARRAVLDKVVVAHGGALRDYYMVADGDWDLVITHELPDGMDNAAAARMMAAFKAGGAVEELRTMRLATAEAFDAAARTTEETYSPPPQP
ncbi:MAG: GYD domain-containing protein [Acidimicrobiales bacterium]